MKRSRHKVVFITPYPKGSAPSQRFRFEQYFKVLQSSNIEYHCYSFLNEKTWNALYKQGTFFAKATGMLGSFWKRFILLFRLRQFDFIFIHREASMIGPPIFEWIIAKVLRRKYIYDFDDAVWLPNYSDSNARFHRLKAYWKIKYIIKWADKVTAGNQYLANYAKKYNDNVSVIPTTLDLINVHNVKADQNKRPLTIVWTGTHTTMAYLEPILPVFRKLESKFDIMFKVISNEKPSFDLKCLKYVPWNKETEIADLSDAHIGIMPMQDNEWSKGKCGFKGLQYMALCIPAVMSPVGVNTSIVEDKVNGFLCSTPEEWLTTLTALLENDDLRSNVGIKGYDTVNKYYSLEANKHKYIELFDR